MIHLIKLWRWLWTLNCRNFFFITPFLAQFISFVAEIYRSRYVIEKIFDNFIKQNDENYYFHMHTYDAPRNIYARMFILDA